MMSSIKDELRYMLSGKGMPFHIMSIIVTLIIVLVVGFVVKGNFPKDTGVAVIDLDNSAYSRELTNKINASEYMEVIAVTHAAISPENFFYQDRAVAVVYFPPDLEKNRYTGTASNIGVFYDNTNASKTTFVKQALSEIIGEDNSASQGSTGSTNDTISGSISLAARNLYNPQGSIFNTTVLGFTFFFLSIFFALSLLSLVPRLRVTKRWEKILLHGSPLELILRILPYTFFFVVGAVMGLALLSTVWDTTIKGSVWLFGFMQIFYAILLGEMAILVGWSAATPELAGSRMVMLVPPGFVLGGITLPTNFFGNWVIPFSHLFPLTWECNFIRDILQRGADFSEMFGGLGCFFIYLTLLTTLLCKRFYDERGRILDKLVAREDRNELLNFLDH